MIFDVDQLTTPSLQLLCQTHPARGRRLIRTLAGRRAGLSYNAFKTAAYEYRTALVAMLLLQGRVNIPGIGTLILVHRSSTKKAYLKLKSSRLIRALLSGTEVPIVQKHKGGRALRGTPVRKRKQV